MGIEWADVLLRAVSGRTESTTDGGEDTEVVTILDIALHSDRRLSDFPGFGSFFTEDSDEIRTAARPACFLSDNGRCMLPRFRHKTSTARREAKGVREK